MLGGKICAIVSNAFLQANLVILKGNLNTAEIIGEDHVKCVSEFDTISAHTQLSIVTRVIFGGNTEHRDNI